MIGGEHTVSLLDDTIEAREPDRAVEARPAVEGDDRPPLPAFVHVQLDVADGDAHARTAARLAARLRSD